MVIVIMGVSGAGKSTVGALLAEQLGGGFFDADAFHPPENVAKMSRGEPLNDNDRAPWLAAMSKAIGGWLAAGTSAVLACSALKQRYRDVLVGGREGVHIVYLKGTFDLISGRMADRAHHFMPASLLTSQFGALEEPENAITVDIAPRPDAIVAAIVTRLDGV